MSYTQEMPAHSRIIIFQSEKNFSAEEITDIERTLDGFMEGWNTHGDALTASYALPYDRFIVIAVDETLAATSGCSLDSLTRTIKELEGRHNFGFMNSTKVSYHLDDVIYTLPLMEFKNKVKSGEIPAHATIFHNGVTKLKDFEESWEMELGESWVGHLIKEEK